MKKLLSVISIVLLILVISSVSSLATELSANNTQTESDPVQIGATNTNKSNTNTNTNKANTTSNTNKINTTTNTNKSNVVGATNKTNTTSYNSSTNSSKLPYAGSANTTSIVLIAIAFVGSAVYAYKKVTDYNV